MRSACFPLCGVFLLLGAVSANDVENFHCLGQCLRHSNIEKFVKSRREDNYNTQTKAEGFCELFNQTLHCATSECPKGQPSEFLLDKLPFFINLRCPANGSVDEDFFAEFFAVQKELYNADEREACANILRVPIWRHAEESCEKVSTCLVDKILAPLANKYDAEVVAAVTDFVKFWKLAKYTLYNDLDEIPPKCLALLENHPAQPSAPVDELKQNFQCLRKCRDLHVPAKQLNPNLTDAHEICEMTRHLQECALWDCAKGKASEFLSYRMPELFGVHCHDDSPDEDFFNKYAEMYDEAKAGYKNAYCLADQLPNTTGLPSEFACLGLHYCFAKKATDYFTHKYGAEVVAAVVEYNSFESLSKLAEIDVHEGFSPLCLALLENRPAEPLERLDKERENFLCLRECVAPFMPSKQMNANLTKAGVFCQLASQLYRCAIQECPHGKGSEFLRHKVPEHVGAHCSYASPDEEFFNNLLMMEDESRFFLKDNCLYADYTPLVPTQVVCRSLNKCSEKVASRFTDKYGPEVVAAFVDMHSIENFYTIAYKTDGQEGVPRSCLDLLDTSRHL